MRKWLSLVSRPSRYIGKEWNTPFKDWEKVDVRVCLAYPDTYEIGMSYLGYKILYWHLNRFDWLAVERAYVPWIDAEDYIRKSGDFLSSYESDTPLKDFDFLGITLQYEMNATNILTLLDLGGIPLRTEDRQEKHPIVIGGGPGAFTAQIFAPFFDCFLVGDGEESFLELLKFYRECKKYGFKREEFLSEADKRFPWLWVPLFSNKQVVKRCILPNLDEAFYPMTDLVPWCEIVHDRVSVEVFRGCARGCRFCQAGMIYRPVRERSLKRVVELAKSLVSSTGYEEMSLTSLASCDYSVIKEALFSIKNELKKLGLRVNFSLPSLRMDGFSVSLVDEIIGSGKKTTLTFAPEAGTQRLRDVINKNISDDDIFRTIEELARRGWNRVKLYFMVGLPTESEEDINGLVSLIKEVHRLGKRFSRRFSLSVSLASFVPKAHTPFQWEGQFPLDYLLETLRFVKGSLKGRDIEIHYHDVNLSFLEAVLSRGDEKLANVIERAWKRGARFDGWNEQLNMNIWLSSFEEEGIDPYWYAQRKPSYTEALPWDFIDSGISKEFLIKEHERALKGETTRDCRFGLCSNCGVCHKYGVRNEIALGT
ncbi:MAG: TIGR03960 family B12-binding radical SAM protein [Synergistetes bacterium]|nr:TIGR03960 family B12-binding radical SAM protein [Synergistota bacterium]MDW8191959.1 TIGR03960 family B12-binding radical SAM protein [Synergistota bacterium]